MFKEKARVVQRATLLLDALVVLLSFLFSFFIRQHIPRVYGANLLGSQIMVENPPNSISGYLLLIVLSLPIWCIILYWNGVYRTPAIKSFSAVAWAVVRSAFFVFIVFSALIFLLQLKYVSRLLMIMDVLFSLVFLLTEKTVIFFVMRRVRRQDQYLRKLLIVGKGRRALSVIESIKLHPEWGLQILGVIDDEPGEGPANVPSPTFIGSLSGLHSILMNEAVDEVLFVVPRSRLSYIEGAVKECETFGVKATVATDLFSLRLAKWRHSELGGIPFVSFDTTVANEAQLFMKRVLDIVLSGIGIIVGFPFYLLIGLMIKLTSRGPVLFKQSRAGLNGRTFTLHKFRTMYHGADRLRKEMEEFNEMDGPVFKIKRDPRVTPVGRVLRKFSLDELPQLLNVFAGHMSLVGPRAMASYEAEQVKPWQRRRLSMRPGMTGLWQISGRNKLDFDTWMELDLRYLDTWSNWQDLKILVKTIPVVCFGIGAY